MKTIIIQLSDLHCSSSAYKYSQKIDKVIDAIRPLGHFDNAFLIISGDLTDKASPNEFKAAKSVIGRFLSGLSNELSCGFIHSMIVPGNHDMLLPDGSRRASEIEDWNKDEHLDEELERLKEFFSYSQSKKCFCVDKVCDDKFIKIGDTNFQICLLNSAPFSTRQPEDKQLHYLPPYVADHLVRAPDADLKITVMHHHFEWCEWNTKEMIKNAILTDDLTFFGHDHKSEFLTAKYSGDGLANIIMGGRFDLDMGKDSTFNVVIYDSDNESFEQYCMTWNLADHIFTPASINTFYKAHHKLEPSQEYIDHLLEDSQKISSKFTDYYAFPKLSAEGEAFSDEESSGFIELEGIFSALDKDRVIHITGNSGAGKTALLRYLYWKSIDYDYYPLLIEKRDYRDSKIDKMFKDLFEIQYSSLSPSSYTAYQQVNHNRKIIFLDDADLIENAKARENLIDSILCSGNLLVYTTRDKNVDLEQLVIDKLEGKSISTLSILPTYKETRDVLIQKIGDINNKTQDEIDAIRTALDYLVQSQTSFFSFTPSSMLQYIKFFIREGTRDRKEVQTLSMVFETNIRSSMLTCIQRPSEANLYLQALEYVANKMYFELRAEKITYSELETIIEEFNSKRKASIVPKLFMEKCSKANVIKESAESFEIGFYDNNTYAYFVAKAISSEYEKNPANQDKIKYVMNRICFGINDTIILFLSFIRSNVGIILQVANKALELMADYPEWDFDLKNIPFLHQFTSMPNSVPSSKEKKEHIEQIERVENDRHEAIKFRGIFDYNEEDITKDRFIIQKALKYTQLVGRALVDQYGSLEAEEIETMLNTLYVVPQKVVYAALKPYQENSEKIIQSISDYVNTHIPDEPITEEHIRELLGNAGTIFALNILDNCAFSASNSSTIIALRDWTPVNSNHSILRLMMEENTGNTANFIAKAIALRAELKQNIYAAILIAQIARKHIFYLSSIDHRHIDSLISGHVLSKESKTTLLLEERKKEKG